MMLFFQVLCLCVTFVVLQSYIVTGVYSRVHRLLPLALGLIGVYNFYEIIMFLTGQRELFTIMKDLLVVQMIYLLLHYLMDVLSMKLPRWAETILFVALLATNIAIFTLYDAPELYRKHFFFFAVGFGILIFVTGTYAYLKYSFSRREHYISSMLYLAFFIPAVTLCFQSLLSVNKDISISLALVCTCLIIFYLMRTDRLTDTASILQENLYDNSEIAMVLFDADCYYLSSNQTAKNLFPYISYVSAEKVC